MGGDQISKGFFVAMQGLLAAYLLLGSPGVCGGAETAAPGGGIVVFRNKPLDGDRFAVVREYQTYEASMAATEFKSADGSRMLVPHGSVVAIVAFNEISALNLDTEAGREMVRRKRAGYVDLQTRCPAAEPWLKVMVAAADLTLKNLAEGKVRIKGEWLTPEQYAAIQSAENERARKAKMEQEEEARKLEERMIAGRKQREEEELRAYQRQAEVAQQTANLRATMVSVAAQRLVRKYRDLKKRLEAMPKIEDRQFVSHMSRWPKTPVLLPPVAGYDLALFDGDGSTETASFYLYAGQELRAIGASLPMQYDSERLINPNDVNAFMNQAVQLAPGVEGWLPLAVASARSKLSLLEAAGDTAEEVVLRRRVNEKSCELSLTRAAVQGNGQTFAFLTLIIH